MSYKYKDTFPVDALAYLSDPDSTMTLYGLADNLGIAYITLREWRREYKAFDDAINKGLAIAKKNKIKGATKYNKKMPERVKNLKLQGKSKGAVCAALGITYETLSTWKEEYPLFKEAWDLGVLLEEEHWEQIGVDGMLGNIPNFNQQVWALNMKNRFKYSEKQELSGNPDKPLQAIQIEFVNPTVGEDDDKPDDSE